MRVSLPFFAGMARPAKRFEIFDRMRLRVPIRHNMMNLDTINRSTERAFPVVTFQSGNPRSSPLGMIWCGRSTAPEMAKFPKMAEPLVFRKTCATAAYSRPRGEMLKQRRAYYATGNNTVGLPPSRGKIASRRTILAIRFAQRFRVLFAAERTAQNNLFESLHSCKSITK